MLCMDDWFWSERLERMLLADFKSDETDSRGWDTVYSYIYSSRPSAWSYHVTLAILAGPMA